MGRAKQQVDSTKGLGHIIPVGSPCQPGRNYQGQMPHYRATAPVPGANGQALSGPIRLGTLGLAVSPAQCELVTGGNQLGGKALFENFAVVPSLPPALSPFPAGPWESNWQQHVRSAADGWCVMGTAGQIWHAGVCPMLASCPATPRYLWHRDEGGEEPPSSLGTQRAREEQEEASNLFLQKSTSEGMEGSKGWTWQLLPCKQVTSGSSTGTAKLTWHGRG